MCYSYTLVLSLCQLLKNLSMEKDPKRKRDIIKKVIAYMTLGIDVSRLFSDMVMVSIMREVGTRCVGIEHFRVGTMIS